jgi:hypothetical protein
MNTDKLIKTLQQFYGNGHIGLASQVGYLTGLLKGMEEGHKVVGKCIGDHTEWLKQHKKNKYN